MLNLAAALLGLATIIGIGLVALYQRGAPRGPIWFPGLLHGGIGLSGYALFLIAWRGAVSEDPGGVGITALVGLTLGTALGVLVFGARLRRRAAPVLLLGIHATLGAAGVVMVLALAVT